MVLLGIKLVFNDHYGEADANLPCRPSLSRLLVRQQLTFNHIKKNILTTLTLYNHVHLDVEKHQNSLFIELLLRCFTCQGQELGLATSPPTTLSSGASSRYLGSASAGYKKTHLDMLALQYYCSLSPYRLDF